MRGKRRYNLRYDDDLHFVRNMTAAAVMGRGRGENADVVFRIMIGGGVQLHCSCIVPPVNLIERLRCETLDCYCIREELSASIKVGKM